MFDKIMGLVKDQVTDTLSGVKGIPAAKQSAVAETTVSALMNGLKSNASPAKLTSLLGMGGPDAADGGGLQSGVISALTSKAGVSPALAQKVAMAVVPAVMMLLKKKVGGGEHGFDLQSLAGGLAGGNLGGKSGGGGIMSMLGSFFGKK